MAVAMAAALVLAACGGDEDDSTVTDDTNGTGAPAAKTVTIGFMGALTGDNANLGINIRDGIQLAVDEANAKNDGITIAVKAFDTAGDPAQAGTVKDQVIGDRSVIGIVGPAFSGESKAVIPALEAAGLVMISPSATNVGLPDVVPNSKVFHRVIADDALQAAGIAAYLADTAKPTAVAYVHDNSEYGKGLTEDLVGQATAKGVKSVLTETVDPKAEDFSATVNKVNAAKPDLVFYGGYYAEAGRFKKQLADAGSTATFVSGDGSLDPGFVTAAGAASAEGARLSCPCNLAFSSSEGKLKTFYDDFKAKIGKEPGLYSPEGYDAAGVLIQGIKAGNTDRASLLNYLETTFTSYEGVSKTVQFAPNGNVTSKDFFVFQVKEGKLAPLETIKVG
ncbi:MAG: branched-chain amino acid ABC transporter substrate-binding protein [Acidimicrobiales bacterium]